MHHALRGTGNREQRVAAAGHLSQARTDGENQIGTAHALRQRRIDADANIPGVIRMPVVQ